MVAFEAGLRPPTGLHMVGMKPVSAYHISYDNDDYNFVKLNSKAILTEMIQEFGMACSWPEKRRRSAGENALPCIIMCINYAGCPHDLPHTVSADRPRSMVE